MGGDVEWLRLFDQLRITLLKPKKTPAQQGCDDEWDLSALKLCVTGDRTSVIHWLQFGEFFGEAGGEDGEAAPGFGVEVEVIDVEGDGVALAFPLVAGPEFEEFDDPILHVFFAVVGVVAKGEFHGGFWAFFIADGGALDGVEDVVGHEIAFVGLIVFPGPEFGGGLLAIDETEGGVGAGFF